MTKQDWFIEAMDRMENIHFSTPHVQNLFDDGSMRYHLVISSSRAVELTSGSESQMGVLLVDMDYSSVSRMLEKINTSGKGQYYYLCDAKGNIIYHPHQIQFDGDVPENSEVAAKSQNSIYDDYLNGVHRKIMVDTISYTGWKLVCVMPYSIFTNKMADVKQFVFVIMIAVVMADVDESHSAAFKYGMKMAASEYGVDVVMISKENLNNMSDEIDVIKQEINKKADAVVFKPTAEKMTEEKSLNTLIRINKKTPIMVVGDQAGSASFKSLNTVEFDQYSMGAELAQKLIADNNGTLSGKKIGIYCENTESDACKKRIDGIKDTLAESDCVVMWIVSGVSDTGEKINLQSQRKVDIVLAIDDASVVEAAKEASDNNLQGALVYGIGNSTEAIYYLDSGWTEALITPDEFAAGYKSVVGLVDMLRGSRKYSVEEKPVSYQLLTRKNLFDEENKKLLYAISQ